MTDLRHSIVTIPRSDAAFAANVLLNRLRNGLLTDDTHLAALYRVQDVVFRFAHGGVALPDMLACIDKELPPNQDSYGIQSYDGSAERLRDVLTAVYLILEAT